MPDSAFCRKCGEKRPGGPKENSSPPRGQRRGGRGPNAEVHGSRDRTSQRRNRNGRSRGGARERRNSRGHPPPADAAAETEGSKNGSRPLDKSAGKGKSGDVSGLPARLARCLDAALASGDLAKALKDVASRSSGDLGAASKA